MCYNLYERGEIASTQRSFAYVKRPLVSVKSLLVAQHNQSQGSNSRAARSDFKQCHTIINYRDSWRSYAVNHGIFHTICVQSPPAPFEICLLGMWGYQMYRPGDVRSRPKRILL